VIELNLHTHSETTQQAIFTMTNDKNIEVVEETEVVPEVVKKGKRVTKQSDKSVPTASTSTVIVDNSEETRRRVVRKIKNC
jgi:tRNA uridine 5-carbamoylmethylation protein Kti12